MRRNAFGLMLIFFLLGMNACGALQPTPTATSPFNPAATGVTEAQYITVPSTATLTPVPSASPTLKPTDTPTLTPTLLPTSMTAIPQSSTSAPTEMASMFGEMYGIEVVEIKTVGSYVDFNSGFAYMPVPKTGYTFLELIVWFYKSGEKLADNEALKEELKQVSVVDSGGMEYPCLELQISMRVTQTESGEYIATGILVHFAIPEDIPGFRLRYRDLPLIDLGL